MYEGAGEEFYSFAPPSPSPVEGEGSSAIELCRAWGLSHFRVQMARHLMAGGNLL
jgi:hypothetical protein